MLLWNTSRYKNISGCDGMEQNNIQTWRPFLSSESIHITWADNITNFYQTNQQASLAPMPSKWMSCDSVKERCYLKNILSKKLTNMWITFTCMKKVFLKITDNEDVDKNSKHLCYDDHVPPKFLWLSLPSRYSLIDLVLDATSSIHSKM